MPEASWGYFSGLRRLRRCHGEGRAARGLGLDRSGQYAKQQIPVMRPRHAVSTARFGHQTRSPPPPFWPRSAPGRAGSRDDPGDRVVPEFGGAFPPDLIGGQDPHSKTTPAARPDLRRSVRRYRAGHPSPSAHPYQRSAAVALMSTTPPAPPRSRLTKPIRLRRPSAGAARTQAIYGYPFVGQPDGRTVRYSDIGLMPPRPRRRSGSAALTTWRR